jgi:predicted transcriptional regulator
MSTQIPSVIEVRAELESLPHSLVQELARISGVPFTTIWKVRDGTTENPGMETVRKFWEHIGALKSRIPEPEAKAA